MKNVKRMLAAIAAASAIAVTTAAVTPASASAYSCINGYICLYGGTSGGGGTLYISCCAGIGYLGSSHNDWASSWYNRSSLGYCLYPDSDYRGTPYYAWAGGTGNLPSPWNNAISSVRPC